MVETKQTSAAPILATLTLIVGFVAVSAFLILFQPWRNLTPWSRLDPAKLAKLSKGMPQADVELLLGGPPGDYGNPQLKDSPGMQTLEGYFGMDAFQQEVWLDDRNKFELFFDASHRLVHWHKRAGFSRDYQPPAWRRKIREWIKI